MFGEVQLFTASTQTTSSELWRADGTAAGTGLVADVSPTGPSSPADLVVLGGAAIYFSADDGVSGRELWRTDGSDSGTFLVADICPGLCASNPQALTGFHGRLWFIAETADEGRELWSLEVAPPVTGILRSKRIGAVAPLDRPLAGELPLRPVLDLYLPAASSGIIDPQPGCSTQRATRWCCTRRPGARRCTWSRPPSAR